jgi:DDE superfamily endonuclease
MKPNPTIEAAGARMLYLPPYSPDFNPIEQLFAKLKALLRRAAERSVAGLWNRIAGLLDQFPLVALSATHPTLRTGIAKLAITPFGYSRGPNPVTCLWCSRPCSCQ